MSQELMSTSKRDCYSHGSGAGVEVKPLDQNSEHQKVRSRLTGHNHEIGFGPIGANADPSHGGGLPSNPFASKSQQKWMFAAEARGEVPKGMAERWAHETPDTKSLPEKKHKK